MKYRITFVNDNKQDELIEAGEFSVKDGYIIFTGLDASIALYNAKEVFSVKEEI